MAFAAFVVQGAMASNYKHVCDKEHALIKKLHGEGYGVKRIGKLLGRNHVTVARRLSRKNKLTKQQGLRAAQRKGNGNPRFQRARPFSIAPVGRPCTGRPFESVSTAKGFERAVKAYNKMKRAKGESEVTMQMVHEELGLNCSLKTLQRAFWNHGLQFRPLYEKPDLTPVDVAERLDWAKAHKRRSAAQWGRYVHAVIDNKVFPVLTRAPFRKSAARRKVRGAYRKRQRRYDVGYVKPRP